MAHQLTMNCLHCHALPRPPDRACPARAVIDNVLLPCEPDKPQGFDAAAVSEARAEKAEAEFVRTHEKLEAVLGMLHDSERFHADAAKRADKAEAALASMRERREREDYAVRELYEWAAAWLPGLAGDAAEEMDEVLDTFRAINRTQEPTDGG